MNKHLLDPLTKRSPEAYFIIECEIIQSYTIQHQNNCVISISMI
jgi:hypothetical protein